MKNLSAREKFMKAEKGVGYLKVAMKYFKDIAMEDDDFTYHIYRKLEQFVDEEDTFIDHEADLRFEAIP